MLVNKPASRWSCNPVRPASLKHFRGIIPPKPVAKPTVPSVASISTKNDPKTLMPQLVLDARYCSHLEHGVEISVSISLGENEYMAKTEIGCDADVPMTTLYIMIVAAYLVALVSYQFGIVLALAGLLVASITCKTKTNTRSLVHTPEPTPPITKDRIALMVGNSRMVAISSNTWR